MIAAAWLAVSPANPSLGRPAQPESRTTTEQSRQDLSVYRQHVETLSNPFMEGRGPGLRGNRIAAEYFEWQFGQLGLKPAFESGESDAAAPGKYREEFTAGREVQAGPSEVSFGSGDSLTLGRDFAVMGNSGSATVEAPVVFVGYSLNPGEPGRGGVESQWASYSEGDDLTGKVALMLRFEPMDGAGKSRLTESGRWSSAADISGKLGAAVDRGAAGIIVVSPPNADDDRARRLESTAGSVMWSRAQSIPVVMLTAEAADRLVRNGTSAGPSLADLIAQANRPREAAGGTAPGIVDLACGKVRVTTAVERVPRVTWNVGGILPGSGPLASQFIIIGGHYDHVGYGYTGGSRTAEYGMIHPGADDNASGSSGVLLAARILSREYAAAGDQPRRSFLFLGFSAEEMGLIGSREFVKQSPISAASIVAMLNMDMIGRAREGRLEVAGTGTAAEFGKVLDPIFAASGFEIDRKPGGRGPSDHATFYGAGIPVLHFFTGLHEEYHTPRDTADLINYPDAVRIVRMVCDVAKSLAERPEGLTFTSTDRPQRGGDRDPAAEPSDAPARPNVSVRFGVRPDNYSGEEDGVLVGDVSDGTAAAEAGIAKGDLLTKWNGQPMHDPGAMMEFLREHKPGDVVDVTLKRGSDELVVRVTLKSRDQGAK